MDAPFTLEELHPVLRDLPNGKANGQDNIRNEALKYGGEGLSRSILKLFNWLNQEEKVPMDWGKSLVAYLYKSGDETDPGNYRGISLIDCLGKLYLSLWTRRITALLEPHLDEGQAGFRRHRSAAEHIFTLNEALLRQRRAGKTAYCFFIDFRKAFDTVWHSGLWKKLWDLGVRGKAWRIIRSLYGGLKSAVIADGELSEYVPVQQGVRQGCPLSPILFNAFINELVKELDNLGGGVMLGRRSLLSLLYADDVVLLADSAEALQRMIDKVEVFCRRWRLTVNTSKSKAFVVGPKHNKEASSWHFGKQPVQLVHQYKYLGVMFSDDMLWNAHVNYLHEKVSAKQAGLARILSLRKIPLRARKSIWTTIIRSALDHGAQVWSCNSKYTKALESLQHRALARMLRTNRKAKREALRAIMGLPSLKTRRLQIRLKFLATLYAKPASNGARHSFDTSQPRSTIRGPQQKPWAYALADTLSKEDPHNLLKAGEETLKQAARDGNGVLPPLRKGVASPAKAWSKAVDAWASRWEQDKITSAANKSRSTLQLIARVLCPGELRRGFEPLPPVDSKVSDVNTIRLRLLCGTHSLNDMMSRITAFEREQNCPLCGTGPETVEHFLRSCPEPVPQGLRAVHERNLDDGARFAALDRLGQCGFILGCKVDGLVPSEADEVQNQELVSSLWACRKAALSEANDSSDADAPSPPREKSQRSIREFFGARPGRGKSGNREKGSGGAGGERAREGDDVPAVNISVDAAEEARGEEGKGEAEGKVLEGGEKAMVDGPLVLDRRDKSSCDPRRVLPLDIARPACVQHKRASAAHGDFAMPR